MCLLGTVSPPVGSRKWGLMNKCGWAIFRGMYKVCVYNWVGEDNIIPLMITECD